jgi:ATP-dependent DNA helicase RecQ
MKTSQNILKQYWGYDHFRPLQQDIVAAVLKGDDVLALLPTGGGKSVCFQVPALMMEGVCLVVTPLIALMKDQVYQLGRRGIKAAAIHSGMNKFEIDITLDNCVYGNYRFLYISPERLQTDLFQARVAKMQVSMLVIDEAHCVSQWGYDFRPLYLQIADFRQQVPDKGLVALTATATPEVKKDIVDKLELNNVQQFQASFARANLSYSVREVEDKHAKILEVLSAVRGSAIIYVRTRKSAKEIAGFLQRNRVSADYYHGGLAHQLRSSKQDAWIKGNTRVMVATNAFGMGIDKADVRAVIHLELPETLEAYYQEAGRGGRDGHKSYAVILHYPNDGEELLHRVKQAHPPIETIKRVYQSLANYFKLAVGSGEGVSFDFILSDFCGIYSLESLTTYQSVKKLEEHGLIQMNESFYSPSRLMFLVDNKGLYEYMIANAQYEHFIKAVLRIYGGEMVDNYISISEQKIAQNLQITISEVKKALQFLHQNQILSYEPAKDSPQIVFTVPRQHEDKLTINQKFLVERKALAEAKASAVGKYLGNHTQCRTQQLLAYFGEQKEERCGVCDVCVDERNRQQKDEHFVKIRSAILKELVQSPMEVAQLAKSISEVKPARCIDVIRAMLDFGEIQYDELGNLTVS